MADDTEGTDADPASDAVRGSDYEYRPVPEGDADEFRRHLTYAFRPTERYDPEEDPPPWGRMGDRRGIYDGGRLCCTGRHLRFDLRIRGEVHPVAGLSAVSTPPQYRRRGLVRRLLAESLAEYRDRELPFSALWPFEHPFYRRFGWATVSKYATATCAPDALACADRGALDGPEAGRYRELDGDDWRAMAAVYDAQDRPLSMDRDEEWWRKRVLAGYGDDPYAFGWDRAGRTDAGADEREGDGECGGESADSGTDGDGDCDRELRGYVVYDVEEGDGGRRMDVAELCAVDHGARLALLRFCRYHDSQVDEVEFYGPPEASLQDLAADPRAVDVEIEPGAMLRIVDVERALGALAYPGVDRSVELAVADDLAAWNDGRFRLTVADGRGVCERVEGGTSRPDARIGIGTLSALAVGYYSVEEARRYGDLSIESGAGGSPDALAALFPRAEPRPFLREGF